MDHVSRGKRPDDSTARDRIKGIAGAAGLIAQVRPLALPPVTPFLRALRLEERRGIIET